METFLCERGLTLSQEKTKITHIKEGCNFLGMNIRKYSNNKLIIKPAKNRVKDFLDDIRQTIKTNATAKTDNLIRLLNQKIRGWANYYAHVCAKRTFNYVDHQIFTSVWRWSKRQHPNKSAKWIKGKYFRRNKTRDWIFYARTKDKKGALINSDIVIASKIPIRRHTKIRANATPFDPFYHKYFDKRISSQKSRKKFDAKPNWWLCWWNLLEPSTRTKVTWSPKAALSKA